MRTWAVVGLVGLLLGSAFGVRGAEAAAMRNFSFDHGTDGWSVVGAWTPVVEAGITTMRGPATNAEMDQTAVSGVNPLVVRVRLFTANTNRFRFYPNFGSGIGGLEVVISTTGTVTHHWSDRVTWSSVVEENVTGTFGGVTGRWVQVRFTVASTAGAAITSWRVGMRHVALNASGTFLDFFDTGSYWGVADPYRLTLTVIRRSWLVTWNYGVSGYVRTPGGVRVEGTLHIEPEIIPFLVFWDRNRIRTWNGAISWRGSTWTKHDTMRMLFIPDDPRYGAMSFTVDFRTEAGFWDFVGWEAEQEDYAVVPVIGGDGRPVWGEIPTGTPTPVVTPEPIGIDVGGWAEAVFRGVRALLQFDDGWLAGRVQGLVAEAEGRAPIGWFMSGLAWVRSWVDGMVGAEAFALEIPFGEHSLHIAPVAAFSTVFEWVRTFSRVAIYSCLVLFFWREYREWMAQ